MTDLAAASLWSFDHGETPANGAEVVAHDPKRDLLFVLGADGIDALDAGSGALRFSLPKAELGTLGTANSVAVRGNLLAASFDGPAPATDGLVALYRLDPHGEGATLRHAVTVGAVPDMVTFVPGKPQLLVAIEGEPAPDYTADPAGGVAAIDTRTGKMHFAGFEDFDTAALQAAGVRLTGPAGTTAATDLEPEYITVSPDGRTAYVSLQENNAIGVLDLRGKGGPEFTAVLPLGTKDHSLPGNGIDASDQDGGVNIETWPVHGLYMPDAIASFEQHGRTYLVTANEGDQREWGSYTDFARLGTLTLDPVAFPDAAALQAPAALGRLQVSTRDGDTDGDGDLDAIYSFGGRSISIWEVGKHGLTLAYDSGDLMERTLAEIAPALLDDGRSDDKGPEPEHVTLGRIKGELYAFASLERADSVMAFRIAGPEEVEFAGLIAAPGDDAPEVSAFAPGRGGEPPRLFLASEGSGTSRAFSLEAPQDGPGWFCGSGLGAWPDLL